MLVIGFHAFLAFVGADHLGFERWKHVVRDISEVGLLFCRSPGPIHDGWVQPIVEDIELGWRSEGRFQGRCERARFNRRPRVFGEQTIAPTGRTDRRCSKHRHHHQSPRTLLRAPRRSGRVRTGQPVEHEADIRCPACCYLLLLSPPGCLTGEAGGDPATARVVKALRILKREGLVIGSSGHGTFVAERSGA